MPASYHFGSKCGSKRNQLLDKPCRLAKKIILYRRGRWGLRLVGICFKQPKVEAKVAKNPTPVEKM